MLKGLKERAARQAAKLAESAAVQRAVSWAVDKSSKVVAGVSEARKSLARQLASGAEDDLEPLKKKLDPHVYADGQKPDGRKADRDNGNPERNG